MRARRNVNQRNSLLLDDYCLVRSLERPGKKAGKFLIDVDFAFFHDDALIRNLKGSTEKAWWLLVDVNIAAITDE